MLDHLRLDLRSALRALRRAPGVTAVAVLTLAIGVGVNTAVFSVLESVLINPLPYPRAERLAWVTQARGDDVRGVSPWVASEWATRGPGIESVGIYTDGQLLMTDGAGAEVFRGQRVNAAFFETLGVRPLLGRLFTTEDDRPPRAAAVVLSYELWTARFGGDRAIVGRALTLNNEPYRIIGVLPSGFQPLRMTNPAEEPRIYAPFGYDPADGERCRNCAAATLRAVARLRDGASIEQARAGLNAMMRQFHDDHPEDFRVDDGARVEPLKDQMTRPMRTALLIALAAAGCVLLIACANVAGLQLARASARAGEFAVRGALGGGRVRLARQVLLETLIVGAAGCAAGAVAGQLGLHALVGLVPREMPRLGEIALDLRALAAAIGAGLITALVSGLAPAWLAARAELNETLARHSVRHGHAAGHRARAALVVAEIAIAFVLVTMTGLLIRTVQSLLTVDAGFDAEQVLTMTPVVLGRAPREMLIEKRQIVDVVRTLPGVVAAGLVNEVPLSHPPTFQFAIEGAPDSAGEPRGASLFWIEGGYFDTLRIPLRRGRLLNAHDGVDAAPAAVVSETLVRRRFPGADPIGRRLRVGDGPWMPIVGVVGDVRNLGLDRAPDEAIYQSLAANPGHYIRLVVRSSGDPRLLERPIRAAVRAVDPTVAIFHVQPMSDYVASWLAQRRFALALMTTFGGLAILLAAVGIHALLAYSVTLRRHELGIRAALGATGRDLLSLVLRRGLALTSAGLLTGILIAGGTTGLARSLLFGVSAGDLVTFVVSSAVIIVTGMLACIVPARRASTVSPLTALRQ